MQNNNTASGAKIVTAKQMMNLKTYGFLNVEITEEPALTGKVLCSHGPDGKPDNEFLRCSAEQAADIAEHLKKIRWSNQK